MIVKARKINEKYLRSLRPDSEADQEKDMKLLTDEEQLEKFFKNYLDKKGFSKFHVVTDKAGNNYYKFIK
jgi:hypothetical protein